MLAVLAFGSSVAGDRGPIAIDRWAMSHLARVHGGPWSVVWHLSSPYVLLPAALLCATLALRRGLRYSAICLLAPTAAVVTAQLLKHVFDRLDAGVPTYPSGTVVSVAAVAATALVATRSRWKPLLALVGAVVVVTVGLAVVALRWHYPTDAIAGAVFAVAVVMVADGLATGIGRRPFRLRTLPRSRSDRLSA